MTGSVFAYSLIQKNNLNVRLFFGNTNHYDPNKRLISLKADVFFSNNDYARVIAAHEFAHAMQHYELRGLFNFNQWLIVRLLLEFDANKKALQYCELSRLKKIYFRRLLFKQTVKSFFNI